RAAGLSTARMKGRERPCEDVDIDDDVDLDSSVDLDGSEAVPGRLTPPSTPTWDHRSRFFYEGFGDHPKVYVQGRGGSLRPNVSVQVDVLRQRRGQGSGRRPPDDVPEAGPNPQLDTSALGGQRADIAPRTQRLRVLYR